jgi:hypothetical protein
MTTGNNALFMRSWHEVQFFKISFLSTAHQIERDKTWFPYNKGEHLENGTGIFGM